MHPSEDIKALVPEGHAIENGREPPRQDIENSPKGEILSQEDTLHFAQITSEALGEKQKSGTFDKQDYQSQLEAIMLQQVHNLPELLAKRLGTSNPEPFNRRAKELHTQIQEATSRSADANDVAYLQVELIFQHLALISRVQNGGDSGFLPSVAKEVDGIDCSLSAWCLQEKLQGVPMLTFKSGYARGHAIAILTLANSKKVYVDAQNGFVTEIAMEEAKDEGQPKTAYPIYKITPTARLSGHLEGEGEITMAREDGCDYLPPYVGVHASNLLHSVGNMHMLWRASPEAIGDPAFWNVYRTKTAEAFRKNMSLPAFDATLYGKIDTAFKRWKKESGYHDEFVKYVLRELDIETAMTEPDAILMLQTHLQSCEEAMKKFEAWKEIGEGGATLCDTKFEELSQTHHQRWKDEQKIAQIRSSLSRPHTESIKKSFADSLKPTDFDVGNVNIWQIENDPSTLVRESKIGDGETLDTLEASIREGEELFADMRKRGIKVVSMKSRRELNKEGKEAIFTLVDKIDGKNLSKIEILPMEAKGELDALYLSLGQHYFDAWKQGLHYWGDCRSDQFVYGNKYGEKDKHFIVVDVDPKFYQEGEDTFATIEAALGSLCGELLENERKFKPVVRLQAARDKLLSIIDEILMKEPDLKMIQEARAWLL